MRPARKRHFTWSGGLLVLVYIAAVKAQGDCGASAIARKDISAAAKALEQSAGTGKWSGCRSQVEYYNNLAFVRQAMGQRSEAVELLRQATKAFPTHAGSFSNLANALRQMPGDDDKEEAVIQASVAVRLQPESPTYRFALGAAQHEAGSLHDALATYHGILGLGTALPHHLCARCHKLMGMVLGELGRPLEANPHPNPNPDPDPNRSPSRGHASP